MYMYNMYADQRGRAESSRGESTPSGWEGSSSEVNLTAAGCSTELQDLQRCGQKSLKSVCDMEQSIYSITTRIIYMHETRVRN